MAMWGDEGPDISWADIERTGDGDRCNTVVQVACHHHLTNSNLVVIYPCGTSARVENLAKLQPDTQAVTLFDVVCNRSGPVIVLVLDNGSSYIEHRRTDLKDFKNMVEVCSGIGIATYGFHECGIETKVACDFRPKFTQVFKSLHPNAAVVTGNISDPKVMKEICFVAKDPGIIFSGFSCQPYSRAGNQLGSDDIRSETLFSTLKIAFWLRIPVIILECVSEASTNRHVRKQLREFCLQCRFHMGEVYLKLENLWPCRRERWWVVLTASALGGISLQPLPMHVYPTMVKQLLPEDLVLSAEHLAELELDPEELRRFLRVNPDLTKMLLNRNGVAPTFLHSLGSQVKACECGCRAAGFSDAQLSRGLFGILCAIPGGSDGKRRFRHPHPDEVAILTAVPVPVAWHGSLRLILAGLGQQASPPHALWIGSQVMQYLDQLVMGVHRISPRQILDQYLDRIRLQAKELVEANRVGQSDAGMTVEADDCMIVPVPSSSQIGKPAIDQLPDELKWMHFGNESNFSLFDDEDGPPLVIPISSPFLTVGNLRAAEVGMLPAGECFEVVDPNTGNELGNDTYLSGRSVMIRSLDSPSFVPVADADPYAMCAPVNPPVELEAISPTAPFVVEEPNPIISSKFDDHDVAEGPKAPLDPLAALTPNEFLKLRQPGPHSLSALEQMIKPQMMVEARLQVLDVQESLWADDEIRWNLKRIMASQDCQEKVILDPLLATAVVNSRNVGLLYQWMKTLQSHPKLIVTVLWHQQHWIPFAWTWTKECLTSFSWDVQGAQHHFGFFHDALAKLVGAKTFINHLSYRQFALSDLCGVCAVRWIQNFVSGQMLPTSADEAQVLHATAREMFVDALLVLGQVPRPWIWGRGLDPVVHSRLVELLTQHGVPKNQVEARSLLAVQAIGVAPLQKALIGTSPWRSLKVLANQVRPALQLVHPDELAEVLKQKIEAGIANPKRRQKKGSSSTQAPVRPQALDPSKIRFDDGVFVDSNDKPLSQIQVSMLGPAASGVVIAGFGEVQEFLKVGNQVTPNPLAVFMVNVQESQLTTALDWSQCRVAARCTANGEPMLVQGYLVQL